MRFLKKLFGDASNSHPVQPVFPGESFAVARMQFPEGWGLATFNAAYKNYPNKTFFPWLVLIELQITDPNETGHPTDEEATKLATLEEKILRFLQVKHTVHFLLRVTRPGIRELLYYIDRPQLAQQDVSAFCDEVMQQREINFSTQKDPEWKAVSGFVA